MIIRQKTMGIIKIVNADIDENEKLKLVDEYLNDIWTSGFDVGKINFMKETINEYKNKLDKIDWNTIITM